MYPLKKWTLSLFPGSSFALLLSAALVQVPAQTQTRASEEPAMKNTGALLKEGKETLRFDTFGSEDFWGDQAGPAAS